MTETTTTEGQGGTERPLTMTQAELDRIIGDRLARERAQQADQRAEYEALKAKAAKLDELEDATRTEQQRLADKLTKAEKAREEAERRAAEAGVELLRTRIAADTGLPSPLAVRLRGASEEEIRADAAELLAAMGTAPAAEPPAEAKPPRLPDFAQGVRTSSNSDSPTVESGMDLWRQLHGGKTT